MEGFVNTKEHWERGDFASALHDDSPRNVLSHQAYAAAGPLHFLASHIYLSRDASGYWKNGIEVFDVSVALGLYFRGRTEEYRLETKAIKRWIFNMTSGNFVLYITRDCR